MIPSFVCRSIIFFCFFNVGRRDGGNKSGEGGEHDLLFYLFLL